MRTIRKQLPGDSCVVGVVSQHSLADWIFDYIDQGIDIVFEEYLLELKEQGKTEDEIEELSMEYENDYKQILFGDWKENSEGKYEIDKDGRHGFAATYSNDSGNICVEWSKWVCECHHTSPCYVMADGSGPCGDLDTEGDSRLAYSLPEDCYRQPTDKE